MVTLGFKDFFLYGYSSKLLEAEWMNYEFQEISIFQNIFITIS